MVCVGSLIRVEMWLGIDRHKYASLPQVMCWEGKGSWDVGVWGERDDTTTH